LIRNAVRAVSSVVVTCPKKSIRLSEEFNEKGYHFVLFQEGSECTSCTFCGRICPDMAIEVINRLFAHSSWLMGKDIL